MIVSKRKVVASSGGSGSGGGGSATLTAAYIGYGSGTNTLTGSSYFQIVDTAANQRAMGVGGAPNQVEITGEGTAFGTGHLLDIVNDNTTQQMFRMTSMGATSFGNNFHLYRGRGTIAVPLTLAADDFMFSMGVRGYDGTGWSQSSGAMQFIASATTWTNTNHGTKFQIQLTPNGSITRQQVFQLNGSGSMYLTPQAAWTPYRTTGVLNIDLSASGYSTLSNGIIIQGGTAQSPTVLLGESTTNEAYLQWNGSTSGGNYSGTSFAASATFNVQSGPTTNKPLRLAGSFVVINNGVTAGSASVRSDIVGLRIGLNSDTHTTNTQAFEIFDGGNIKFGSTNGSKIGGTGSKLAMYGATPIVQPTTAIAAATYVSGGGAGVTRTDTFGGYTLEQLAAVIKTIGLAA